MNNMEKDKLYLRLVRDILENEEFNEIKKIDHHGITRFDHSLRVSYYSYRVSKLFRLDYDLVARAGLLHDFFFSKEEKELINGNKEFIVPSFKDKLVSTFIHPKQSVENARRVFNISDKEADMIRSHMFPIYTSIPKYAESWIVSIVDKCVATYEFSKKFSYKFSYATNLFILMIIKNLK